jgi:hypothetical protein
MMDAPGLRCHAALDHSLGHTPKAAPRGLELIPGRLDIRTTAIDQPLRQCLEGIPFRVHVHRIQRAKMRGVPVKRDQGCSIMSCGRWNFVSGLTGAIANNYGLAAAIDEKFRIASPATFGCPAASGCKRRPSQFPAARFCQTLNLHHASLGPCFIVSKCFMA